MEISKDLYEAKKLTSKEGIMILFSIAFGVGYISVLRIETSDALFLMMTYNFIFGIISCYMLSKAKQMHSNKMGSYPEIVYYYTKDRSLIFIICF